MLTTTFRLAKVNDACIESYRKFAKHVGGITDYGRDTPIPLTQIAEVLGVADALWCLRCTQQPDQVKRLAVVLAADFAEHVLPHFEKVYPDDKRPREAIRIIRQYLETGDKSVARAAADAAWAAAYAAWAAACAAWAAAYADRAAADAAWAAAYAAGAAAYAAGAAAYAAWAAAYADRATADAAGAAAYAAGAAAYAARAAAYVARAAADAARAAERRWQLQRFKEVVE